MSQLPFNARFTPQSSLQVSADEFDITADVFDGLGIFFASDVQLRDVVYLDCFASLSAPGTVCKYVVTQVQDVNGSIVSCRIRWADSGIVVDPGEITFTAGFISRQTTNRGFAFHASPTVHTLPDYVVQYSRNIELEQIIDPFYTKYVKNGTASEIAQYSVVAWQNDGTVALATASAHSLSDLAGIAAKSIPVGEFGWVIKVGYVPNALASLNPSPGATVFLSTTPGTMALTRPTALTDTIIKIGRAEPPSGVATPNAYDLHLEMEIFAEP